MAISLLFFSSAEISLPLLKSLISDESFEIQALICQPDRPAGRGKNMKAPATKKLAEESGIEVFQPSKLSDAQNLLNLLNKDKPDFILTFAYGQIMNQDWLNLPNVKSLNVHTSLLPKYRGASPIQAALLNGDKESGITLMEMVRKMDAGPFAFQDKVSIDGVTTAGTLHDQLAELAAKLVPDHLKSISANPDQFTEQNESQASHCSKITREDGFVDFKSNSELIVRQFQAYSPWPGIWTTFKGKRLKILDCKISDNEAGLVINGVEILKLQLEGKKPLLAKDFLLGQSDFSSESLPS
ncbi:MAG: methionyl-tRNA formyltransferase [Oceanicoccus sp.]|jgi:methionyl-tRNA formyltransferase